MRNSKIPTIFIGTSVEGISTLEALLNHPDIEIVAVVTQPDKPSGRTQELKPTPIKERALALNLPIVTPEGDDASYKSILDQYKPELALCIAFGQFIPEFFLNALKFKCLNVHYSLLPILRGAVPVQSAILQGLPETGVTIQIMERMMDTGPIIAQEKIEIFDNDTTQTLKDRLIPLGQELLVEIIGDWVNGRIVAREQDNTLATYCFMKDISKERAEIDWNSMTAEQIERMVRALVPWPIAWTTLPDGTKLKIFSAKLLAVEHSEKAGTLLQDRKRTLFATSHSGMVLEATEVQREGKARMSGEAFIKGYIARM